MTDQARTKHEHDDDDMGRQSLDKVTAWGTGIDQSVQAIGTTYDALGRVDLVTSYDDDDIGSANVVNEVQFEPWPATLRRHRPGLE